MQTGAIITVSPEVNTLYAVFGEDADGCGEASKQILISVFPCTGIDELKTENDKLRIYPNPVSEVLNIEFINSKELEHLVIYDIHGKVMVNEKLKLKNSITQIDISKLKSGIYFSRIGNVTRKFVKE